MINIRLDLIKQLRDMLANETDTSKYRVLMATIAFLESTKDHFNHVSHCPCHPDIAMCICKD